jgi:transcriptional regulator with XRE-family HTH domain
MFRVSNREVFSNWLQSELEIRDWSQSDLSKRSGVHRAIISKIILGSSMPMPETLEAIAKGLHISPVLVFQKAGLLPPNGDADQWIEEMNHKMGLLDPSKRPMAEKLLNALLEEDKPVTVNKKVKART